MDLRFLFPLLVTGVVFVFLFWLVLLVPAFLSVHFEKSRVGPFVTLLSNLMFIYALCLWPAFCATLAWSFSSVPSVDHRWTYYIAAWLSGMIGMFISIGLVVRLPKLKYGQPGTAFDDSLAALAAIVWIKKFFLSVGTVSLFIFLFCPKLAMFLYGWILVNGL